MKSELREWLASGDGVSLQLHAESGALFSQGGQKLRRRLQALPSPGPCRPLSLSLGRLLLAQGQTSLSLSSHLGLSAEPGCHVSLELGGSQG